MRNLNRVVFLIFLLIAGLSIWGSFRLPSSGPFGIGPGFMPRQLGIILIVLASINFLKNEFSLDKAEKAFEMERVPKLLMVLGFFGLYVFAMSRLGTTLATFLFFIVILTVVEKRELRFVILESIGLTVILYLFFNVVLRVPLPGGVVERFLTSIF